MTLVVAAVMMSSMFGGLNLVGKASDTGPTPMADWTVSGAETIDGYIHYQRGNVIIPSGASLTITDGGLVFQQDTGPDDTPGTVDDHIYRLEVQSGGSLIMSNSLLSSQLNELYDYPKLSFTVNGGTLSISGSTLKFPGSFYMTNSNAVISRTTITGHSDADVDSFVGDAEGSINTIYEDDNNDAPIMLWDDSDIEIYDSNITKIYENGFSPNLIPSMPNYKFDITLTGATALTVVNSFVGIDFNSEPSTHNRLVANDTSKVYMYNMTVDESENPVPAQRVPALLPWGPVVTNNYQSDPTAFKTPPHNAVGSLADITNYDGSRMSVSAAAANNTMFIDSFSVPVGSALTSAQLWVVYSTDLGYAGTDAVTWAFDGGALNPTTIVPVDTGVVTNETSATYDLFAQGVDTLFELMTLDISFINNGGQTVYFNIVNVNITYVFVSSNAWFYNYRWLDLLVTDEYNVPAGNTYVQAHIVPTGQLAYYPDNGFLTVPPANILNYMGKTALNFNVTDTGGHAVIPLFNEWINMTGGVGTMPNSEFVGNYELYLEYLNATQAPPTWYPATQGISFPPYPNMTWQGNTLELNVTIPFVQIPRPDLSQNDCVYFPTLVYEGDVVQVQGNITNVGDSPALDIFVSFYEGPTSLGNFSLALLNPGSWALTDPIPWTAKTTGSHIISILADPGNTVSEKNEANNTKACPITVAPNQPNLRITATDIGFSANPVPNNPVNIYASINNTGRANASNVLVYYFVDQYVNGIPEGAPIGSSTIILSVKGAPNVTSISWTPPDVGTYEVCIKADPNNAVVEDDETDNLACVTLIVNPAPNLFISTFDIVFSDPFPKQGDSVGITATVTNAGTAPSTAGSFLVEFEIDGQPLGTGQVNGGLAVGASATVPATPLPWSATAYGWHTVTVTVDSMDTEANETNENDNVASRQIFVYRHPFTWYINSTTLPALDVYTVLDGNIEIRGELRIRNTTLFIDQNQSSMHVIKVLNNGRLILENATITSNYPLTIYVTGSGTLETHSYLNLTTADGEGLIYTDGSSVLRLNDTVVDASIRALGRSVQIYGSDLRGSTLFIDTAETSYVWDAMMTGVSTIQLVSDDGNPATLDFDLGNLTFNEQLTGQLAFGGQQSVKFTNVTTYVAPGKDWYDGMVSGSAMIMRYWWVTARNVDGTGNPLGEPDVSTSNVTIQRWEFQTFTWVTEWSGDTVTGSKLWPTLSETRYASPTPHTLKFTYRYSGDVVLASNGVKYLPPGGQLTVAITNNTVVDLSYPQLAPDLWVSGITFTGGNGISDSQPKGLNIMISATISNLGQVAALNARVDFYTISLLLETDGKRGYPADGKVDNYEAQLFGSNGHGFTDVPAGGTSSVTIPYLQTTPSTGAPTISAFTDLFDDVKESDESNNELENIFNEIFSWPDYAVSSLSIKEPVTVNRQTNVTTVIRNNDDLGTGSGATVSLYVNSTWMATTPLGDLAPGASTTVVFPHTFTATGAHDVMITVEFPIGDPHNRDYFTTNNQVSVSTTVLPLPDLVVDNIRVKDSPLIENKSFQMDVNISNNGLGAAVYFNVSVYYQQIADANELCSVTVDLINGLQSLPPILMSCKGLPATGTVTIYIKVDSMNDVDEELESNNEFSTDVFVEGMSGEITISYPTTGTEFDAGASVTVKGNLTESASGDAIENVQITIFMRDSTGARRGNEINVITDASGSFEVFLDTDPELTEGDYSICASTTFGDVSDSCVTVRVAGKAAPFPWWIIIMVIIIIVIAIAAAAIYLRRRGLGKLVECGECGALIPEGSVKCPKCGVEFETDMVKCSSCGAWIQPDLKSCPECGVEFVVGEVKPEDYQKLMKKQYDDFANRIKEDAKRIMPDMTDAQFQDWWRRQPTYISFEQWMKEEEEKRTMGSTACPSCNMLNSVTATICHKCGTSLKKTERPPAGGPQPPRQPPAQPAPAAPQPAVAPAPAQPQPAAPQTPRPMAPVPKKVVKKPIVRKVTPTGEVIEYKEE